jgi:hypothetical protein
VVRWSFERNDVNDALVQVAELPFAIHSKAFAIGVAERVLPMELLVQRVLCCALQAHVHEQRIVELV